MNPTTTTRYSKKREAILTLLRSTKTHPTAEWIYQNLKQEIPDLSLGTVYRNLNFFREQSLAQSVGTVAGQERFDGNPAPHPHFVCDRCHAVLDVPTGALPDLRSAVGGQYGFKADSYELIFHGLCAGCAAAEKTIS